MCNQITNTRSSIISQPYPSCNRDCGFFPESKTLNPKRKIHSHPWATSSSVREYGSLLKPEGWVCSTRALPDRSSSFKVLKVAESKSLQTDFDFEITWSSTGSLKLYILGPRDRLPWRKRKTGLKSLTPTWCRRWFCSAGDTKSGM